MSFPNNVRSRTRCEDYPYRSYVAAQTRSSPCLSNLSRFLESDASTRYGCRITCMDFTGESSTPSHRNLGKDDLAALLHDRANRKSGLRGRIVMVEDLTRDVIEQLGSQLNIDPYFFASHLDVFQPDISTPRPYLSKLPSMARTQDSLFLHYHRVLEVDNPTCERTLIRAMNVPRKVKLLPPTKGVSIGFARHCCSVLRTSGKDGLWLCQYRVCLILGLADGRQALFLLTRRQEFSVPPKGRPVRGQCQYLYIPVYSKAVSKTFSLGRIFSTFRMPDQDSKGSLCSKI